MLQRLYSLAHFCDARDINFAVITSLIFITIPTNMIDDETLSGEDAGP